MGRHSGHFPKRLALLPETTRSASIGAGSVRHSDVSAGGDAAPPDLVASYHALF
jgi:hypothetical protein